MSLCQPSRKSLSGQTYQLSKSLRLLGSAEDNSKLAAALQQLADVEEKVEKVHEQQAKDDFYLLSELIHDYIGIVGAVKDAFNERVKAWQSWQGVQVINCDMCALCAFYHHHHPVENGIAGF